MTDDRREAHGWFALCDRQHARGSEHWHSLRGQRAANPPALLDDIAALERRNESLTNELIVARRAANPPALDVERLRAVIRNTDIMMLTGCDDEPADLIAAEYARLTREETP